MKSIERYRYNWSIYHRWNNYWIHGEIYFRLLSRYKKQKRKVLFRFTIKTIYSKSKSICFNRTTKVSNSWHDELKYEVTQNVKEWYDNYCLYLLPELRNDFRTVIHDVNMYDYQLEDYKATGREQGWNTEEAKKKKEELNQTFKSIMQGMQDKIQAHTDIYYKYIE